MESRVTWRLEEPSHRHSGGEIRQHHPHGHGRWALYDSLVYFLGISLPCSFRDLSVLSAGYVLACRVSHHDRTDTLPCRRQLCRQPLQGIHVHRRFPRSYHDFLRLDDLGSPLPALLSDSCASPEAPPVDRLGNSDGRLARQSPRWYIPIRASGKLDFPRNPYLRRNMDALNGVGWGVNVAFDLGIILTVLSLRLRSGNPATLHISRQNLIYSVSSTVCSSKYS